MTKGFHAAQSRYDRMSELEDPPIGDCPWCIGETTNYEGTTRRNIKFLPCDDCKPCKDCDEETRNCTCEKEPAQ